MYDLSTPLGDDALADVRAGTSFLVTGPAMSGKEQLTRSILAEGVNADDGAVVVSTEQSAQVVREDIADRVGPAADGLLGVVDTRGEGSESQLVHHVSSPGDLTGIGIAITKCLQALADTGTTEGRLALSSLSTMLTYTSQETVFKFCHVLSARLDSAGYLGLFTIDSGAHEDQTMEVMKRAFDAAIETRLEDDRREARVVGLGEPTPWQPF